jgi:hypothetical protein
MNCFLKSTLITGLLLVSTLTLSYGQSTEPMSTDSINNSANIAQAETLGLASDVDNEKTDRNSGSFFMARKGQAWLGGGVNFMSMGAKYKDLRYNDIDDSRLNMLSVAMITRFFPANNFCMGPKFGWNGMFVENLSINTYNIGGDIGAVFGNSGSAMPYFITSPHAAISSGSYGSNGIFVLPFTLGVMVPIGKSGVAMQYEFGLSFAFEEKYTINSFSIGFGISGLGKKVAVSMVNTMGLFSQLF